MVFSSNKEMREEKYVFDEETGKITIFHAEKVSIEEILPLLIKSKRAKKHFSAGGQGHNISWTAIQPELKTRSIDDIRNFWQLKILPIFDRALANKSNGESVLIWREKDDI